MLHVARVELHEELTAGIAVTPVQIRHVRSGIDVVAVLLAVHLDGDALRGEAGRAGRGAPEQLAHGGVAEHLAGGVLAAQVHVHPGAAAETADVRMRGLIPALPGVHICGDHLLVGREGVYVLLDGFAVDARSLAACRHVAAGIEPALVQLLRLEPAEDGLDGLRGRLVRRGGTEDGGDLGKPFLGVGAFRAALVIGHQLVGLVPGENERVAVCLAHHLEVLDGTDAAAQEDLGRGVDDLVHVERGDPVPAVHVGLVEEVEPGTITIPQGVAHGRQRRGELVLELALGGEAAQGGALPARADVRTVQRVGDRGLTLHELPPAGGGLDVVTLQDLRVVVDGHAGALEGDQEVHDLVGHLAGIAIDQVAGHQGGVANAAVVAQLLAQSRYVLREGVRHDVAKGLAAVVDRRPVDRRGVAGLVVLCALRVLHLHELIEHGCVHGELVDLVALDVRAVGEQVVLEEMPGGFIHHNGRHFLRLGQLLQRISVLLDVALLETGGQRGVDDQRAVAQALALTALLDAATCEQLLVVAVAHHWGALAGVGQLLDCYVDGSFVRFHCGVVLLVTGSRVSRYRPVVE